MRPSIAAAITAVAGQFGQRTGTGMGQPATNGTPDAPAYGNFTELNIFCTVTSLSCMFGPKQAIRTTICSYPTVA